MNNFTIEQMITGSFVKYTRLSKIINETYYVRRLHNASLQGSKKKGFFDSFLAFEQIYKL